MEIMAYGKPLDERIVKIDAWWDRHTRCWVIQCLNADGYQIGDAVYCGNRQDKDYIVRELMIEHGIKEVVA